MQAERHTTKTPRHPSTIYNKVQLCTQQTTVLHNMGAHLGYQKGGERENHLENLI